MTKGNPPPDTPLKISWLISALATALFTGLMACFIIAIDPTLSELDGSTYATVMQKLIQHADHPPLVPMMVIASIVAPPFTLYFLRQQRSSAAFKWTLTAFIFAIIVLLITVGLNVQINNYISSWNPASVPADWSAKREAWHQLNLYRTPASALALIGHLMAGFSLWKERR